LQNITTRLGTHEDTIMANKLDIAHNSIVIENMADDVTEIKSDVKVLLGSEK
jgi:hypothetical protein